MVESLWQGRHTHLMVARKERARERDRERDRDKNNIYPSKSCPQ
jgi:hypothetical protein